MQSKKPKINLVVPPALKRAVKEAAEHRGCSVAEVIKAALYEHLKEFIAEDNIQKLKGGDRNGRNTDIQV